MKRRYILPLLGSALMLSACIETDTDVEADLDIDRSTTSQVASFSPATGAIPFPSNLLLTGSQDGTINIPGLDETNLSDPQVALNALDGFSTIAPISTQLSQTIDASTLNAQTVQLFEVTMTAQGVVTGVTRKLSYGSEYVATVSSVDPEGRTLVILPTAPLKPKTAYMAAITSGIQNSHGKAVIPSVTYMLTKQTTPLVDGSGTSQSPLLTNANAQALEPLRQLTNIQEAQLAGQGLSSDLIVLSWTFRTQSTSDVLSTVRSLTSGTTAIYPSAIGDTAALLGAGPGLANVYVGTLTLPYYLTDASSSPLDPLTKHWQGAGGSHLTQYNPTPVKRSDETVPLLVSVPKTGSGPWPVVIYQHGITQNRTNLLAIADALASQGFVGVAIDMPLHGLPPGHPLYMNGMERTFDLDLVNNTTRAAGSDGVKDESGTHYINLSYLLTTRDNVRQSIADLFALYDSLATLDFNVGGADLDTSRVYFLGHSLGAMVGIPFLALESGVRDAVLAMPGGGIAKLLDGSARFGPVIAAGLAAAGVDKGTADYEAFMGAAQTVMDSADPANYATQAASGRGLLLFEVVGDGGTTNLPDQVVPNNVMAAAPEGTVRAPLSGTDPLAALLGLTRVSSTTTSASDMRSWLRFTAGDHASLLNPAANAATTSVMQTATAAFLASDGLQTVVSNTGVVE